MSKIIKAFSPFPITKSLFTEINIDTRTVTDGYTHIHVAAPSKAGSNSVYGLLQTAPTTPYSATFNLRRLTFLSGWASLGVGWRSSSDGYITFCGISEAGGTGGLTYYVSKMTLQTYDGYTSTPTNISTTGYCFPDLRYFRLIDDNTDRKIQISWDGINFQTVFSMSRTSFHTPDQIGVMCNPYDNAVNFTINHFKIDYSG